MNRKRFEELLSRLLDESITLHEGDELAAMVAEHLPLRHELHGQFALDEALSQLADASRSARQFAESTDARLVAESGRFEFMHRILDAIDESSSGPRGNLAAATIGSSASKYRKARFAFVALACAAVAAVGLVALMSAPQDRPASLSVVAVGSFSRSANVQWAAGAHRWSVGDTLAEGQSIEFDSGRVELQFDSGALMTVVGPAALEIKSANLVALHSGTATTRIEDGNSGKFRVVTPATEVLDLGTEFGVRARSDGQTDVVVFEGKVDVTPVAPVVDKLRTRQTLLVGEAVCVNEIGNWKRLVSIDADAFPMGDAMFNLSRNRPSVILGVSDNLSTSDRPKFYAVVPGGFREDAKAYVDRAYEWNGLDQAGLPPGLLGGDYIQTFNDDRYLSELAIAVTVAGPATLYVLIDDRIPSPDWLFAEFLETGLKVGLDTGMQVDASSSPHTGRWLGVGRGHRVDHACSVWKRDVRDVLEVHLGPTRAIPNKDARWSMYGIVVVPAP